MNKGCLLAPRLGQALARLALPLHFGTCGSVSIRREKLRLGVANPFHLLYASDLHLGHWWTRSVGDELVATVREVAPSVVLLGGDLVDNATALDQLDHCLRRLAEVAPVYAIPGNHDERVGIALIRAIVIAAAGHWLPDEPFLDRFPIDGAIRVSPPTPRILCAHYPSQFPEAVNAGYRLVLAGHLHGGQCVLATYNDKLYPAAWLHRWHGLRFRMGDAVMLVSRGLGDTLPLRFNCPREVLVCEIE